MNSFPATEYPGPDQPVLLLVPLSLQVVGPRIGNLEALLVDEPEIQGACQRGLEEAANVPIVYHRSLTSHGLR